MTIKELINELSKMNPEAKVLMLVCDGIEDPRVILQAF